MNAGTRVAIILAITLVVVLVGGGALFYYQSQKNTTAQDEKTIAEVGKLIELPTDEKPTVATVTDPERLRNQEFFQKAKSGDKVLIYTNAKKAILYDPVAKKIIDVAPVNTGTPSAQTAPQEGSGSASPAP